ncbi:MAG: IS1634 family transposase [Bacteroidota bacterium]|nr:IS1634 family transposase [Bacteroidota bacterium]
MVITRLYHPGSKLKTEDDLRKMGFSKEGKHQHPQIYLGLLVSVEGYPIGYDIFEGNIFEGHTLIPTLDKFEKRFSLNKPIVIADAGLLTQENIRSLQSKGYTYIIGARIKNETKKNKQKILTEKWFDGHSIRINKDEHTRLIAAYSAKRAAKDAHSRRRGLNRLEKNLKAGKLKGYITNTKLKPKQII